MATTFLTRFQTPSYKARLLAAVVRKMPSRKYLDYIRSVKWQKRRREHLTKFPYCEICHLRPGIQVHHWHYKTLGYEDDDSLASVCVACHHSIHCAVFDRPAANDNQLQLPLKAANGNEP